MGGLQARFQWRPGKLVNERLAAVRNAIDVLAGPALAKPNSTRAAVGPILADDADLSQTAPAALRAEAWRLASS